MKNLILTIVVSLLSIVGIQAQVVVIRLGEPIEPRYIEYRQVTPPPPIRIYHPQPIVIHRPIPLQPKPSFHVDQRPLGQRFEYRRESHRPQMEMRYNSRKSGGFQQQRRGR